MKLKLSAVKTWPLSTLTVGSGVPTFNLKKFYTPKGISKIMGDSWKNLEYLITTPSILFARLKLEPRWVLAFTLLFLVSAFLSWGTAPFETHLIVKSMPTGSEVEFITVGVLIANLAGEILWIVVLSALLTGFARIFQINEGVKFKHISAGLIHISLIQILIKLFNSALLMIFRKVEEIETVADMQIIPGLHNLTSSLNNVKLRVFLGHINVLSLWYIIILTIAIAVFTKKKKSQACFWAVAIWLFGIVISTLL